MSLGSERAADVVVVGGGFAGVGIAARAAQARAGSVLLVNPGQAFLFRPWLIHTATGHRTFEETQFDLRSATERFGFELVEGTVVEADLGRRVLELSDGDRLTYGAVAWTSGAEADRARIPGAAEHALWPCDLEDAQALAARLSANASHPNSITVVLGGERPGPGLEYGAAIAAHLANGGGGASVLRVLDTEGRMSSHLGRRATDAVRRLFEARGSRYEVTSAVDEIGPGEVRLAGGQVVPSDLTLVIGPLRGCSGGLPRQTLDERGFVLVDEHLRMSHAANAFAAGDVVAAPGQKNWMLAQRQARVAVRNLLAGLGGREDEPQRYDFDRALRVRLALPDLAGDSVLVRNERMLASGRLPLLVRRTMDRSFLSKHALGA